MREGEPKTLRSPTTNSRSKFPRATETQNWNRRKMKLRRKCEHLNRMLRLATHGVHSATILGVLERMFEELRMKSNFRFSLIAGVLSAGSGSFTVICAASAQNDTKTIIFQIGKFDRSTGEFASGNPQQKVNFAVSQSDPSKDWFGKQSAVLSSAGKLGEASVESAPRAISFSIAGRQRPLIGFMLPC